MWNLISIPFQMNLIWHFFVLFCFYLVGLPPFSILFHIHLMHCPLANRSLFFSIQMMHPTCTRSFVHLHTESHHWHDRFFYHFIARFKLIKQTAHNCPKIWATVKRKKWREKNQRMNEWPISNCTICNYIFFCGK